MPVSFVIRILHLSAELSDQAKLHGIISLTQNASINLHESGLIDPYRDSEKLTNVW